MGSGEGIVGCGSFCQKLPPNTWLFAVRGCGGCFQCESRICYV